MARQRSIVQQVDILLRQASTAEIEQIRLRCVARLGTKSKGDQKLTEDETYYYDALISALRPKTKQPIARLEGKIRTANAVGFDKKAFQTGLAMLQKLEQETVRVASKTHRVIFYRTCVRAAIQWLKDNEKPVSIKQVLIALQDPETVIDHAFPGYIAAGLLGLVIRQPIEEGTDE